MSTAGGPYRSPSHPGDDGDYVTIETFNRIHEAEFAKALLDAAGIEARVLDEGVVGANPFLAPVIGGVRLQVARANADRALDELKRPAFDTDTSGSVCLSCNKPMDETATKCVACGWTFLEGV